MEITSRHFYIVKTASEDYVADTGGEAIETLRRKVGEGNGHNKRQRNEGSDDNIVEELGEDMLRKIRSMTGSGEAGEKLAHRVFKEGLSMDELDKVEEHHERGANIDDAIKKVKQERGDEPENDIELGGDEGVGDGIQVVRVDIDGDEQTSTEVSWRQIALHLLRTT